MGIIRKTASVFTAGAIDFMSDKERMAHSARVTKRNVKKQRKLLKEQNKLLKAQMDMQNR